VPLWRARLEMQWLRVYGTLAQRPRRLQAMDLALMTQRTAVSIDKARRLLGFTAQTSIDEGMRRCATWLQVEGHLPPAGWVRATCASTSAELPQCRGGGPA
jgi:hypothetical protein